MRSERRIKIKNSIATKLLAIVFSLYLLIAIAVTLSHMILEYRYQKKSIRNDLVNIQQTFEPGLSVSLWEINHAAVVSEINGILKIPAVVGIKVLNENGKPIAIGGLISHKGRVGYVGEHVSIAGLAPEDFDMLSKEKYKPELFEHQFPISHRYKGDKKQIGTATIYSSSAVIYQRVKLGFFLLIINALIKTTALWLIFLWISNVMLRKPLAALTSATDKVNMDNLAFFKLDIKTSGQDELKVLEESFNLMISKLHQSVVKREQDDEKIKQQQFLLEKAQELGKLGTWEIDIELNRLYWTDENCRIFGVPIGTVAAYEIFLEKVHPDDREFVNLKWKNALKGEPYDIEHRILIDGKIKWVREKADVNFDETGKLVKAVGITQDITERKEAEKKSRKHLKELEQWYLATLNRKERVLELKAEVNKLIERMGEARKYSSQN